MSEKIFVASREKLTKVLFPRFEYEASNEGDYYKREIIKVPYRQWLLGVEVEALLTPQVTVSKEKAANVKNTWWGVYHSATEETVQGRLFTSPFTNGEQLFRSRYIDHEYLWDQQALPGRVTEIILERLSRVEPRFEEVCAILADRYKPDAQKLVIAAGSNHLEPRYDEPDNYRDFCIATLLELAERTDTM